MSDDLGNSDTASRLTEELHDAERRYSEALAAVDRAVPKLNAIRRAAAGVEGSTDQGQSAPWEIMREEAGASPLRRLIGVARELLRFPVAGVLRRQQGFNQAVMADLVELLQGLERFHHDIVQYMQRVGPLVDTKYRHQMVIGSGLSEYVQETNATYALRWETTMARDRRIAAAIDEVRTSIATVQQAGATLKRELERLLAAGPSATADAPGASKAATPSTAVEATARAGVTLDAVNAYKYVGFEDKFRGSEAAIRERLTEYLPLFEGAADVLDLGCGRGEFLVLLGEDGIRGRGLDINHEMVELCRSRGLDVAEGDALAYLTGLADGSLGGLFAAQVVEHFQPGYLIRLLDVAFHKLRPGSQIVLETLNPACWSAFFDSYIRDVTHAWPLHPDTLKYLVTAAGFQRVDVTFLAPYSPEDRLQNVTVARGTPMTAAEKALVETINGNVDTLNRQLFSNRDYAVIARRP